MTDDRPPCTLDRTDAGPTTCYCTGRPGCQYEQGVDVCLDCGEADCWGECEMPRIETVNIVGGVL